MADENVPPPSPSAVEEYYKRIIPAGLASQSNPEMIADEVINGAYSWDEGLARLHQIYRAQGKVQEGKLIGGALGQAIGLICIDIFNKVILNETFVSTTLERYKSKYDPEDFRQAALIFMANTFAHTEYDPSRAALPTLLIRSGLNALQSIKSFEEKLKRNAITVPLTAVDSAGKEFASLGSEDIEMKDKLGAADAKASLDILKGLFAETAKKFVDAKLMVSSPLRKSVHREALVISMLETYFNCLEKDPNKAYTQTELFAEFSELLKGKMLPNPYNRSVPFADGLQLVLRLFVGVIKEKPDVVAGLKAAGIKINEIENIGIGRGSRRGY